MAKKLLSAPLTPLFCVMSLFVVLFVFQNCSPAFMSSEQLATLQGPRSIDVDGSESNHPGFEKVTQETTYEAILADRYYLQSLFEDIFGPQTVNKDSVKSFYNVQDNGSPCSLYEDYKTPDAKGALVRADAMQVCSTTSPDRLTAQVNPKATVTRQARLARTCSDLTNDGTTLGFALAKIGTGIPKATDENLASAFGLFYRDKPLPDAGLIESLRFLVRNPDHVTLDDWRAVLYTICVSPQWQVL